MYAVFQHKSESKLTADEKLKRILKSLESESKDSGATEVFDPDIHCPELPVCFIGVRQSKVVKAASLSMLKRPQVKLARYKRRPRQQKRLGKHLKNMKNDKE